MAAASTRVSRAQKTASKPAKQPLIQVSQITTAAIAARRRRGRKTQTERSTEMRERVLEATVHCLVNFGYTGTTFSTIAQEAGVSRGALQHHYPEKAFLVVGALEMIIHRVESDLLERALRMPLGASRISFVLDQLWLATLTPPLPAVADVRIAARTDAAVRSMLLPLEHAIRKQQYKVVSEAIGGDLGAHPDFAHRVEATLATMRGLAMQLSYGWERGEVEAAWIVARNDFVAGFQRISEAGPLATKTAPAKSANRLR